MRLTLIALVLCICLWLAEGDVAHLNTKKARFLGRLKGHHKRGVYSTVPTYKLGHDIPLVTHSVVKPVVVSYPPTASVTAVKVPITRPHSPQFPVIHKSPIHKLFGHKFPHSTKTLVSSPSDQHYHHHHHHVAPRPVVPVLPAPAFPATPIVPIAQPNTPVAAHPIPAPAPPVFIQNNPTPATVPAPVIPQPILPQPHVHLKPTFSAAHVPLSPAPIFPAPVVPLASQYPYILRPGNAVQTSYFATYPRYPLLNYQSPLIPLATPAAPAPVTQLFLDNPQPQYHFLPQPNVHNGVFEDSAHGVAVEQSPTLLHPTQSLIPQPSVHLQPDIHLQANPDVHLHAQPEVHLQHQPEANLHHQPELHLHPQPDIHLQPAQPAVHVDNNGWSPVPAHPHDHPATEVHHHPESQEGHFFTQEQGTQVFEHHSGNDQQYHDLHQLQHHIQQQIEHSQYEQQLNNHNLNPDYITQQEVDHQQHANHNYDQHHGYHQDRDLGLQPQPAQEYGLPGHLGQEYGAPHPGFEGRSEGEEEDSQQHQLYHNHIPLGLQPPLDRPLEHFR